MNKTIKDIGERGLLEKFQSFVDIIGDLPFNDDAVSIPLSETESMVINIDTFVAKTDAPPKMTSYQMGGKAATMAISDLAAKGVQTEFLIVSGCFPENFPIKSTLKIVQGIKETGMRYNAKYIGGDTNAADDIILSIVALGRAKRSELMKRNGAVEDDIICTTGTFGLTGAGFQVFLGNKKATNTQKERFKQAIYNPIARVKEGLRLAHFGKITSCIDSSDGLAWCLKEIIRDKKQLGITITNLPIDKDVIEFADQHNLNPRDLALFGGEEFELVFTLNRKYLKQLQKLIPCYPIGEISTKNPEKILLKTESEITEIIPKGWEHFR